MQTKIKKMLAVILSLPMIMTMIPMAMIPASAAEKPTYTKDTDNKTVIYANGTDLFIEEGTVSGTAVYYMNGSTKTYVNPNGAKGDDLSNSEIFMGTASTNADNFDVSLVMNSGEVGTIYTAKSYGYLIGKVTIAVIGTATVSQIICGSKNGPGNGMDLHGQNGNLAIFDTVGVEISSGPTGVDGIIKHTASGWEISGSAVIPAGVTMAVDAGQTVTVPANASIQNNGTLINNGTLELYGAVTGNNISGSGKLNCHTAYIENVSSVSSISAKINGESVTLLNGQYRILDNQLYIWLPNGDAQVTLNSVKYYGIVSKGQLIRLTTAYTAPNEISGIPSGIIAYVSEPLSAKTNSTTFDVDFTYEVLASGTTAAGAKMINSSLYASGSGAINLKVTANDGYTTYSKNFNITVSDSGYTASIANGSINISKHSDTQIKITHAGFDGGSIVIDKDEVLLVIGTSETEKDYGITVQSGTAKVIFKDVSITRSKSYDNPPVRINSGATLNLSLAGTNVIINAQNNDTSTGGTNAGIHLPENAMLIIDGEGALNVTGGKEAAGIGAAYKNAVGTLVINGGTITATGGSTAAGIGGGYYGTGGTITINGGTIIAVGGSGAAGIGGGSNGNGGAIIINGGTVTATCGSTGAGIGGGSKGNGGTVTINGGVVTAKGGDGAGIGGGYRGAGETVVINGGTVTATASNGAGIGGGGSYYSSEGNAGDGGSITINGGFVNTKSSFGAAIGGGGVSKDISKYNAMAGAGGTVKITGGTVVAQSKSSYSGYSGAGIGGGASYYGTGAAGGTVVISGGNIKATSTGGEAIGKGYNGTSSGTLKNANGNPVTLNTITINGAAADTTVTQIEGITYGLTDVKTLDTDKLYFWLPADTAATAITAGGNEYICNGNLTYYTAHNWSNLDGICANGCGLECDHAGQTGESCEICGKSLHTHSFTYSASGDTITAVCENTDGNCPDSEGTLTIFAPADLYVDGTTAKEATVENNLVDTSVTYEVTYSTADGSAPTTAGTYTASVTIGGATASVQFELVKRSAAADDFIYTAPENLVYDGTAKYATVEVSPEITGMGEITVTYYKDGEAVEPINAGTYTVKVSTAESDKYYALTDVEIGSFTIAKKTVTTSATVQDKVYDGTTTVAASAIEITFDGIVDGDDVKVESVNAIFKNANAGNNKTVYVSYKISGEDVNNYDIYEEGVSIPEIEYYFIETKANILPKDIADAEIVLGDALTYNGTEQAQAVASVTVDGLAVTYTVSGDTATNVGVYELTITANTNFTGTKTALYTINPDLSGIEGLDQYNVKSTNKADIEYVYNQLDNAVTDLASAEKEAEWKEIKDECWQWLKILESVAYRVESLGNSYLAYDIDTVTSADDEALLSLEAEIYLCVRDYGDNMTEEELDILDNAWVEIANLRERIAKTKSEYDRVIAAANSYDEATVTSADKDDLVQLNDDIYALALTDNVTAEELENLENAHDKILGLIDKLTAISDEIKRIIEAVDKYVFESVKSSDKTDIEQLIADIKALLDTKNITADERTLLLSADETCTKLIEKIDETVAEISRINDATNAYDEATVTSADKADIEKLLADIKALTDGDNITDAEREQLNGNETTLKALLDKIGATADEIARIEEAVNGYDEETVKSTDKADLEQLIEDIKALTDATNITEDERTKLGELDAKIDALIKKIDDTAAEIARIDEAVNGYDKETVTSDDVPELGKLIEDIKALTDGDNLTEDEKAALEETEKAIDDLVEKLAEVAEEIKKVDEAVKSYDEDSVKSTDSEDLTQLKEDIQNLIDSDNTTENEKTALEEMIKDIEGLEDKIDETEEKLEEIKDIENEYNPETVSSDDKSAIEEAIAEIEKVNPDNLTDEQKAEYEEIKAGFEALLEEIAAAEKNVADIGIELEMFDEERVTKFWEDDIEALKAKIDELLANENMGEAEKAKLGEYKAQAEKLIEIINDPCEYFSLRFFYLIWDCLTWKYNGILWLFSKVFSC